MNVHQGHKGAKNEAFLSSHLRRVPRITDDPPPPFVTKVTIFVIKLHLFLMKFRKFSKSIISDKRKVCFGMGQTLASSICESDIFCRKFFCVLIYELCVAHDTLFANNDENWQNDKMRAKHKQCVESDLSWFVSVLWKTFAKCIHWSRLSLDEQKVFFFAVVRDIFRFCRRWIVRSRRVFVVFHEIQFFHEKVVLLVFVNSDD